MKRRRSTVIDVPIPIQDFPSIPQNNDPHGKQYILTSITGRELKIPRKIAEFSPGHVILPKWFCEKVLRPDEWGETDERKINSTDPKNDR